MSMSGEDFSRQGTKRPRDDLKEDDTSVSSLLVMSGNSAKLDESLSLPAPAPKRPRAPPSNQIQYVT